MWSTFFIATVGASAGLAGLVFVALSVNINRILQYSHLPARAGATIGTLILILICSLAVLLPQPPLALGIEVLVFAACGCVLKVWSAWLTITDRKRYNRPLREGVLEAVLGQAQVLPFIVGAILLISGDERGLYWMAGGCFAIFIFSVFNAWVLLVEILR